MSGRNDPEDSVLSSRERLALRHIAAELSADRRLARRMRHLPPRLRWLTLSVSILTCASLVLVVMGIRTSDPNIIWSFAVLWPLTLIQAFRLLCRLTVTGDRTTASWR
ncbi:DUF3040 domain-containing protein [Streptomyces sp. NPDC059881]|uniref:DUF3040 domain-containing protein n=1 Tax=Streptomyces sp. NPDC059881 TaxID=3346986 RepID=UPI0036549DEB